MDFIVSKLVVIWALVWHVIAMDILDIATKKLEFVLTVKTIHMVITVSCAKSVTMAMHLVVCMDACHASAPVFTITLLLVARCVEEFYSNFYLAYKFL